MSTNRSGDITYADAQLGLAASASEDRQEAIAAFQEKRQGIMRVVTWNIRRATRKKIEVWDYLSDLDCDLMLLQEVNSFPDKIKADYDILYRKAISEAGRSQPFGTAVLVKKGAILKEMCCSTKWEWVNKELRCYFKGYFITASIDLPLGAQLHVMSIHSPAWPINKDRLKNVDVAEIKLTQNPKVWGTELIWAMLRAQDLTGKDWIVAGDFNSSETFGYMWRDGPRGNKEFLERMYSLGLSEALRESEGKLTPTFRNTRGGKVIHQIDHMFVGKKLFSCLERCWVGSSDQIFDGSLSDHLPIITEFDLRKATTKRS